MNTPDDKLARVKALLRETIALGENATPQGNWKRKRDPYEYTRTQVVASGNEMIVYHNVYGIQVDSRVVSNMDFIAHACNSAVATARALLGQIELCEAALESYRSCGCDDVAVPMLEQILSSFDV